METFKRLCSLHGFVMFMFLTTISKGSACEAPSSPQCFRRNAAESVYMCEWGLNSNEGNVTFDLYFNKTKFGNIKKNVSQFPEERLIKYSSVDIWVEAHVGNSSCTSPRRSVILGHTVKYEAPQNISAYWLKNNLSLSWQSAEKYPALAEVWFRQDEHHKASWTKRNMTTEALKYRVIVANLLKHSAYQVQIRQKSTKAQNSLWSDWSPVVIIPAELEDKPEVTVTTTLVKRSRNVTLTFKSMPHAAAFGRVTYSLEDSQSSHGCPCMIDMREKKKRHRIHTSKHSITVSYSAVNVTVIARNTAGPSPPEIIEVPAEPAADLTTCDKTLMNEKLSKRTCLELYELHEADSRPENVIILSGRNKEERKQAKRSIKDYIRYLYFEHRCEGGKPQTVQMCLFYKEEGAPIREPQDIAFSETHNSAMLSWKAIPYKDQRGFLTHYSLCTMKISSQDEATECYNISTSLTQYQLENLKPGTKYNISLAGVTRIGEGPAATLTFETWPEKSMKDWLSFTLLFIFFLLSTMCTIILKRIKNKIFPPVPIPVILDFTTDQPENQEMLERKEEVHEVTLHQLHPEGKSICEEAEETTVLRGDWDSGTDEDVDDDRRDSMGSSDECLSPGSTDQALKNSREGDVTDLEQVDTELAMLIYRNGLVFDVKTDSS